MRAMKSWAIACVVALAPCAAGAAEPPANANATLVYFDAAANATFDPLEPAGR